MSTRYFFQDLNVDELYDSFNQQLHEIHRKCMDLVAGMNVDPSLKDLKNELLDDLKSSFMFDTREAYHKKIEIGSSTDKAFYWMDHKGFDGLLSVQKFMNENPRMVITNGHDEVIPFSEFRNIVSPRDKSQIGLYSDKEIVSKPSLNELIQAAAFQSAKQQDDSLRRDLDIER